MVVYLKQSRLQIDKHLQICPGLTVDGQARFHLRSRQLPIHKVLDGLSLDHSAALFGLFRFGCLLRCTGTQSYCYRKAHCRCSFVLLHLFSLPSFEVLSCKEVFASTHNDLNF